MKEAGRGGRESENGIHTDGHTLLNININIRAAAKYDTMNSKYYNVL